MKKISCLLVAVVLTLAGLSQNNIEKKKFHFGAEQDTAGGYTQALRVDNVIYISGTVATDITEKDVRRVYRVIEKSLEPFGATLQNVVKETIYTTDIEAMKSFNHIRKAIYKGDYPASTWVQISRLFMPEAKLEIEVVAHLKK
jgi:enamine deaminase RidA (YjgF/YER057c/UK114 family)